MGRISRAVSAVVLSALVHAAPDLALGQAVDFTLLGIGPSGYTTFTPGQVVTAGGGGSGAGLSDDTPKVANIPGEPGVGTTASRHDHVHPAQGVPIPGTSAPKAPGTANAGMSDAWSRSDHVHPAQAVPQAGTSTPVAPGTGSAGTADTWSRSDHRHPAETVPQPGTSDPEALGTASAGAAATWSRSDHVHPTFAAGGADPKSVGNRNVQGVSTAAARADHQHASPIYVNLPDGNDNVLPQYNESRSEWDFSSPRTVLVEAVATAGVAKGKCIQVSDTVTNVPRDIMFGYGDCGGGGEATPLSDKTPLVESGSGSAGAGAAASREDHVHPARAITFPLSDQTPQNVAATASAGTAATASREDHVHGRGAVPREVPAPTNSVKGDIPRVNAAGSAYELVDAHVAVLAGLPALTGQAGKVLTVNSGATGALWAAAGGGGSGGGGSWENVLSINLGSSNTEASRFSITLSDAQNEALEEALSSGDLLRIQWGDESGNNAGCFLPGVVRQTRQSTYTLSCVFHVPNSMTLAQTFLSSSTIGRNCSCG